MSEPNYLVEPIDPYRPPLAEAVLPDDGAVLAADGTELTTDRQTEPKRHRFSIVAILLSLLLGLIVGALGTAIHRTFWSALVDGGSFFPIGLVLGLALTASVALFLRSWRGILALLAFAIGWIVASQTLSLTGPGGDVIVVDPTAPVPVPFAGLIWDYVGIALMVIVALLPRRWFRRTERVNEAADAVPAPVEMHD